MSESLEDRVRATVVRKQLNLLKGANDEKKLGSIKDIILSCYNLFFKKDYDDKFPNIEFNDKKGLCIELKPERSVIHLASYRSIDVFDPVFNYCLYYEYNKNFRFVTNDDLDYFMKTSLRLRNYITASMINLIIPEYVEEFKYSKNDPVLLTSFNSQKASFDRLRDLFYEMLNKNDIGRVMYELYIKK